MVKINPEAYYSLQEVQDLKLLPMMTKNQLRNYAREGKIKRVPFGHGKGRRYRFKGEWIIDFSNQLLNRK